MTYESPAKKHLDDLLAKHGKHLSAAIRGHVEKAIAGIDHTDPAEVLARFPEPVMGVFRTTVVRAAALTPAIAKAHAAGCFIESIILSHGLIQFALRALYVLSWQRSVLPRCLTEVDLKSYYRQGSKRGDVFPLIRDLEQGEVIFDHHATHLRSVNEARNKAAHGVIFGEIDTDELGKLSEKAHYAALGALDTLQAWFNNPKPLKRRPGHASTAGE